MAALRTATAALARETTCTAWRTAGHRAARAAAATASAPCHRQWSPSSYRTASTSTAAASRTASWPWDAAPALDPATQTVPSQPYDDAPLPGSAPNYHTFLVLHPAQHPRPPTSWPQDLAAVCPLLTELNGRTRDGASLQGFGIALSDGFHDVHLAPSASTGGLQDWDPHTSKFIRPLPSSPQEHERFHLHIYTAAGKHAVLHDLSLATLDDGEPLAHKIKLAIEDAAPAHQKHATGAEWPESHIYVCMHGMRDCRCGVAGSELYSVLVNEVQAHEDECAASSSGARPSRRVRVAGISHIGGHKWAANAIVHTDWYGNLRTSDAKLLLRAALAPPTAAHDPSDTRERLVHWPRWRGRLGMNELEQREHYAQWGPDRVWSVGREFKPRQRGSPSTAEPSTAGGTSAEGASVPSTDSGPTTSASNNNINNANADTLTLHFRASSTKQWYTLTDAREGENLKDVAKRHALPSIEATCGGQCECATCHAYIVAPLPGSGEGEREGREPDMDNEPPEGVLSPKSEAEEDMLDYAIDRRPSSRLTCQLTVTKALADWMARTGGWIELPRF